MKHEGNISGIGNELTRKNEITADGVATFRNYVAGYTKYQNKGGVVNLAGKNFSCTKSESDKFTVDLQGGLCFAYGYFAYMDKASITFLPPAVKQYHIIYVELNRGKIPNAATIMTKNNQSSPRLLKNTLRQDELFVVKTGVFQVPLWSIEVTNSGIGEIVDLMDLRDAIENVVCSDITSKVESGGRLGEGVTCHTELGRAKEIANCAFVIREITSEINR